MGCSATVAATVTACILQLIGTLCISFVIAIVVSCHAIEDPGSPLTCGSYTVGQPCVNDDNIAVCNALLADGCTEEDLIVAESCPVQFGCVARSGRRQQQAYEECGPAGVCGDHAHCVSACDQEICSSVRCQCEPGFEPRFDTSRSRSTTTCVESGPASGVPTPAPAAISCGGAADGPCHGSSGKSSALQSPPESATGHVNLCYAAAGPDWITTKVLGVVGAVLLGSAVPLLSSHAHSCSGCGERRDSAGARAASRAWQLYVLASFGSIVCGLLGIGFSVSIPMVAPAAITCVFNVAFGTMCWARTQESQTCLNSEVASQAVPLVVVASAVMASDEKS